MDLKEEFFNTGEMRLHYLEGPQAGPPLVLLHGATGNCHAWDDVMPNLTQHWQVFALDLRGHGQSGRAKNVEGYHVLANVNDILAFLRGRVKSPAVLVGHSWGAVISLLCAAPGKDLVRALVLEDPPLAIRRQTQELKPFIDYFTWLYQLKQTTHTLDELSAALQAANGGNLPPEILNPLAKRVFETDAIYLLSTTIPQGSVTNVDFTRSIQEVTCPMLLLQADLEKNVAFFPEDLDFVLQHARNTHAPVVRFPGAGHGIHFDQPVEFLHALETFFQTLKPFAQDVGHAR